MVEHGGDKAGEPSEQQTPGQKRASPESVHGERDEDVSDKFNESAEGVVQKVAAWKNSSGSERFRFWG